MMSFKRDGIPMFVWYKGINEEIQDIDLRYESIRLRCIDGIVMEIVKTIGREEWCQNYFET